MRKLEYALIVLTVFASRVPFLDAGYGLDPDSYRVAQTAQVISETGKYFASRFPGYPIQELFYSLIWQGGPPLMNGVTALITAVGSAFFALTLKHLGGSSYVLAAFAYAFTPVVYIASTTSMDYTWAISFVLGSLYFLIKRNELIAGILLGIAIGCRITSGAIIIPFSLYVILNNEERLKSIGILAKYWVTTILTAVLSFLPVYVTYGWRFFSFYDNLPGTIWDIISRLTVQVWGTLGFLGLAIASTLLLVYKILQIDRNSSDYQIGLFHPIIKTSLVVIILFLLAFSRLPLEAGYLIPIVPFVIILFGSFQRRIVLTLLCASLIISPFVSIGRSGINPGQIFNDYQSRKKSIVYIDNVLQKSNSISNQKIVIVGHWLPQVKSRLSLSQIDDSKTKFVYSLTTSEIAEYELQGYKIYYLLSSIGNKTILVTEGMIPLLSSVEEHMYWQ